MSSSIAIPPRKRHHHHLLHGAGGQGPASSASSSSSFSSSSGSPRSFGATPTPSNRCYFDARPSLLSSSIARSEHIVVNIGDPDAPRLITCVKASQGFDWNSDIFLPSYVDYSPSDLELKQDPVQDIVLTDEEAAALLPQ